MGFLDLVWEIVKLMREAYIFISHPFRASTSRGRGGGVVGTDLQTDGQSVLYLNFVTHCDDILKFIHESHYSKVQIAIL